MLTMRSAAALLSASRSVVELGDVARVIGQCGDATPLDEATRDALGLEGVQRAEMGAGVGAVRYLLAELSADTPLRDGLERAARRLASRAPHVLWLIAAVDASGTHAGIVAWSRDEHAPRLVSLLWEPTRVVDSDAETLCALAAISETDDVLVHAHWIDVLGRDALTRRFYRTLESRISAMAATLPHRTRPEDARQVALLYASRLLFLRFLEAKGWLNGERAFLAARFDDCMKTGGAFHRRVLLPLFFGTLNTPPIRRASTARRFGRVPFLNGGLFTRTAMERRVGTFSFPDECLGDLFENLFDRFRFVAREDTATWSEASVDPEMLGRAFESLMASGERRTGGVYFTPHALVARVAEHALESAIASRSLRTIRDLRVLDPACGSGAFLVYVLERVAAVRRELGESRPVATIRRDVLAHSVFGVDRNPTAVWLCELRLWLSVVIETEESDPERVPPLPNLDRNIRVGDALVGPAFARSSVTFLGNARITALRMRYIRATGARKQNLARALDREERARVLTQTDRAIDAAYYARKERLAVERAFDLFGRRTAPTSESRRELRQLRDRLRELRRERRRILDGGALPFSFGAFFADAQANGGFDAVLGNPPWVRLHRIPTALRLQFKQTYEVYRAAPWADGASGANAAPGFASQVDLAALFVERSVSLLRNGGFLSLLLPAKLWRSLAGGGLRHFLARSTGVVRLEDMSESRPAFDAAVYPSLLVARAGSGPSPLLTLARHDRSGTVEWQLESARLPFDGSVGAPWIVMPTRARAAFDRVRAVGVPLATTAFGPPRLGVKSGCNAAFLVRVRDIRDGLASIVDADGEEGTVELAMLRPALRGDSVLSWQHVPPSEWIIWTHGANGAPLTHLPERTRRWLRRRYDSLATRTDAVRARRWWTLFRVDAADTQHARVVWADFGKRPRAIVLRAGDPTVPLNTCYVLPCPDECDAWTLATILNSQLAASWLNALAEPARGGYHRYLAWTVGLLPLPRDWSRARAILSPACSLPDESLLQAVLSAYRLEPAEVAALLEWPG